MRRLVPVLFTLAACGGGSDLGEDLACEYDPHAWWDNPFYTLLAADEDGHFDFDPVGDPIARRVGDYGFETGDIAWTSTYADGHPYLTVEGSGYGTIYDNGDVDLVTKNVFSDVLGATWAEQVRTKREGCTGTVRNSELDPDAPADAEPEAWADSLTWEVAIVADDQVDFHMEREEEYGLYVWDSTATPDIASQGTVDYADGGYVSSTTMRYDGTGEATWAQYGATFGDDYDFVGADTFYFDGSTLRDYNVLAGGTDEIEAEVVLLYLYDGSATGTYTASNNGNPVECEVTITAGGESCTMECGSYGTYDC